MSEEQRRIPGPLGNRGRQNQPGQFVPRGKFVPNRGGQGQRGPVQGKGFQKNSGRPYPAPKPKPFQPQSHLHPRSLKYMNGFKFIPSKKREELSNDEREERAKCRHMGLALRVGDLMFRSFNKQEDEVFLNWCLAGSMIFAPWQVDVIEYVKDRIREITGIDPIECVVGLQRPWSEGPPQMSRIRRKRS